MGEKIKSALELAMEKVEKLGEVTEEERLKWKYVPEGEKLAAKYIKQECNLLAELGHFEAKARKQVTEGAGGTLVRNINLPKDDLAKRNNRRAMEGLKNLKSDKVAVENVYSQLRHLFNHYMEQGEQQRKQAYETLKTEFEAKVRQAMQQQPRRSIAPTSSSTRAMAGRCTDWSRRCRRRTKTRAASSNALT